MLHEHLVLHDPANEYVPQLPLSLEQVIEKGSQLELSEDCKEEVKAKFLVKLVALYNRVLER